MLLSIKRLKEKAKCTLGYGPFAKNWFIATASLLFISVLTLPLFIIVGPVSYGIYRIFKHLDEHKEFKIKDNILAGFNENFSDSSVLAIAESLYLFLWSCLLFIPGIIKSYSYAMSMYILEKNPKTTWDEAHKFSKKLMDGNKWTLFVLDLSFIGWYLVGFLCFGVGFLFVKTYHKLTRYYFFETLYESSLPFEDGCLKIMNNKKESYISTNELNTNIEMIDKLYSMKQSGALVEDEYNQLKKMLISPFLIDETVSSQQDLSNYGKVDVDKKPLQTEDSDSHKEKIFKNIKCKYLFSNKAELIIAIASMVLLAISAILFYHYLFIRLLARKDVTIFISSFINIIVGPR